MLLATGAERAMPVAVSSSAQAGLLAVAHQPQVGISVPAISAGALEMHRDASQSARPGTFMSEATPRQIVEFSAATATGITLVPPSPDVSEGLAPSPISMILELGEFSDPSPRSFFSDVPLADAAPAFESGTVRRSGGFENETIGDVYSVQGGTPIYSIRLTSRITLSNDLQFVADPYTRIELLDSMVTAFRLRIDF
jgi:hypothetical protein